MSLICPNLCFIFIKGKSLLIICPYNFFQYFSVKFTGFWNSGNQPSTFAQPCSSNWIPIVSGLWRRIKLTNLLVLVKFIFILFSFGKFISLYYHNQIYCTINDPTYLYQFCINKSGHFLITLNQRKPCNSLT